MAATSSSPPMTLEAARSTDDLGLVRGIGRWAMVALMINGIIGAGIFGLPSRIHSLVGPWGLLAFVACALVVGCMALCFAEVSSRFTLTGGPYLYTQQAFGPLAGFLIGWLLWITRLTALAAIGSVMASYLAFFWTPAAAGWGRGVAIGAVMVALTLVNLVGVGRAAAAVNALTIGKLVPLLLFVGVGLFFLDPPRFASTGLPGAGPFSKAVLQLIFAFGGFEAMVIAAGEMKDPRRNLPFALLVAIAVSTGLYILIQTVCIGTLPGLATSQKPLADASARFMGTAGGSVVAVGALVSTVGTMCSSVLVGPRLLYAMSEQHQLPRWFGATHRRFRTPQVAILLTAAAALALALSGTFTYVLGLNVIARLLTYLSTAGALLMFRHRHREQPALFSVPAGGLVASLAIAACLWLLTQSAGRDLRDVGIAIAVGLAIHLADRWRRVRRPAPGEDAGG